MDRWLGWLLAQTVRFYQQAISPYTRAHCRFEPTCSAYAREALLRYGAWTGLRLTVWRLVRCGPWHPGGYDPVPEELGNGTETRRA